ncbi:FIG00545237: hypothetical protein [hydrothermal vent metagenome]|uniref:Lipoprotein n=1 Tax=hydrothermal vent metagenome TaxID=652676 RepID=A0A1W1BLT1_9ZZZZ
MYKNILFLALILFFSACSSPKPPAPNEKAFEGEDLYILYALQAEQIGSYKTAVKFYQILYERSKKREYLYHELQNQLAAGQFKEVVSKTDALLKDSKKIDPNILRYQILAYVHQKQYDKAREGAIKLVKLTNKSEDYLLLSDIYVKLKKYNMAVKYLDGAYSKNYDERILDRISIILFMNLGRQKDAIAQLETHSRMFGCSKIICNRLLSFYSKLGDVDGMLSVYKRYYKINKNDEVLAKIIQIYTYKKDYIALMHFLEKNGIENEILLQLYVNAGEYKKAYKLATQLYRQTEDINYLGQAAIYEYEAYKHPKQKRVQKIARELQEVVAKKPSALYLNYLGYLLIDHNLDIKKGMKYVRKALQKHPDSAYYLDSLAWGYYKLHKCQKAKRIFDRVRKLEGGDDKEVLKHYKKVVQCLKKRKHTTHKRSKKKKGAK